MARAALAFLILASALLAGCAASTTPEWAPGGAEPSGLGLGRLEGAVVDERFVGVSGARVGLEGVGEPVQTGPDGRFAFGDVTPGDHRIRVEAPLWLPAEVRARVEADALTQVTVFLEPKAALERPYSTVQEVRGRLNCVDFRAASASTEELACDSYRKDLGFPERWAGTVTEVTWAESATSTPYTRVSLLSRNESDAPAYARQIGESPSKLVLRPETLHTGYQASTPTPREHKAGPLFIEVVKSPVLLVDADVRAGLAIQQDFRIYQTVFFVEAPDGLEDYSAIQE